MKKILLKIKNISMVSVLSFSLCFSAPMGNYYQAAEVVDTTVWTLLETLFLSLGVTFSLDGEVDKSQIDDALVSDMLEIAEGIENGTQKGALLEAADCIGNLINYWDDVTGLTIPQTIWEGLKYYVGYEVAPRPIYKPNSDINLYGCSLQEYIDFLTSYFPVSSTNVTKLANATYDDLVASNYCGIFGFARSTNVVQSDGMHSWRFTVIPLDTSCFFRFGEGSSTDSTNYLYINNSKRNSISADFISFRSVLSDFDSVDFFVNDYSVDKFYSASSNNAILGFYERISNLYFIAFGQLYKIGDVLSSAENVTTKVDFGNTFYFTDVDIPEKEIYTGVISNGVSDVMDVPADAYDILVDGRTWDEKENKVVGDVVLPIPSQELLDMYYQGLITWQELLESMGITPVNTETGETLDGKAITDAIIETSTDILEVLKAIPQALLDGVLGLFLPAEGFIQEKIDELMKKLGELGVVPYDMSDIFKGGDNNPFKDIKITIYGKEVTIVSFAYLPPFLDKFRPVIRGLMVLFMLFYSINQLLALFRISGMMQGGNISILGGSGSNVPQIADKGGRA